MPLKNELLRRCHATQHICKLLPVCRHDSVARSLLNKAVLYVVPNMNPVRTYCLYVHAGSLTLS